MSGMPPVRMPQRGFAVDGVWPAQRGQGGRLIGANAPVSLGDTSEAGRAPSTARAALAAIALVLTTTATAQPHDDLLSLYAQAQGSDPQYQLAAAQQRLVTGRADAARAPLLPQWSLQAQQQRVAGEALRSSGSTITQTLVDVAALYSWRAAETDASAEDARRTAAEQALRARVARAYFGLLSAQSQLATAETTEAAYAEQVRQNQVRVDNRLAAPLDVQQARAYLGLAQTATLAAREQLADAVQAMQELTGQPPLPLKPLRADLHPALPQPNDAAAWVAEARDHHPLVRATAQDVQAASQRQRAARAGHLPTLGLAATTQRAPVGGVPGADARTQTIVGLQLTVPLFSGGATLAQQQQAAAQHDANQAQHDTALRAAVREAEAQFQAAQGSVAQVAATQAAAEAAEQALTATRAGLAHGTRGMTDLLIAIQTQAQAQNAHALARHRHVLALVLLRQAAGRLGVDDLTAVNALLETD